MSFHSHYRCGHSGACCTSNWPIPIEADRLIALQAAIASGALAPIAGAEAWMTTPADAPEEAPALLGVRSRKCVFFDEDGGRTCRIHTVLGHDALPLACRQFPRLVVHDPRGVSITLSHYCPTAGGLLSGRDPVRIEEQPAAFPASGEYEGLDARRALPPLLHPDMLMDWESWWRFEAASVALLTTGGGPTALKLGRLREAVERARDWTPSRGPLAPHVTRAFEAARTGRALPFDPDPEEIVRRLREIDDAIPSELRPGSLPGLPSDGWHEPSHADRFLAAHAFANWTAHLGNGLHAWLRSIQSAYICLRAGLDFRETDLRLRHLASPNRLAESYGARGR